MNETVHLWFAKTTLEQDRNERYVDPRPTEIPIDSCNTHSCKKVMTI
jgi:hypothetical protein